ncbi:HTH-type transcriptional repressor AcnR [Planctomycetes bacterium Pan216]|uniref:HTH-type transcriptional repressor AcnR n=1 Tax=Kolteria novifilia TaxID=2527975 RepID=A0A518AYB6_9BACT|nr:HTH-type transcriptional repressor AcnR [Planctomycetes bacterium Pan216]
MASGPEDTKARILEAAAKLFADKGFDSATVREICQEAGANLQAISYHFGDKASLYVEAVKYAHRLMHDPAGKQIPTLPGEMAPEAKLELMIRAFFQHMFENDPLRRPDWCQRLVLREFMNPTQACRDLVDEFIRPANEQFVGIIQEILPGVTDRQTQQLLVWSLVGQCTFFRMHRSVMGILVGEDVVATLDAKRLSDHVVKFTLAALAQWREDADGTDKG